MRHTGVLTYHIEGQEHLNETGRLIIANHPSLIDVVFLIALIRDTNCIVKDSLVNNPFTRGPTYGLLGYAKGRRSLGNGYPHVYLLSTKGLPMQ